MFAASSVCARACMQQQTCLAARGQHEHGAVAYQLLHARPSTCTLGMSLVHSMPGEAPSHQHVCADIQDVYWSAKFLKPGELGASGRLTMHSGAALQ